MLGYTAEDVYKMMATIKWSLVYIPSGKAAEDIRQGLQDTYNLLDGLLVEGHVL